MTCLQYFAFTKVSGSLEGLYYKVPTHLDLSEPWLVTRRAVVPMNPERPYPLPKGAVARKALPVLQKTVCCKYCAAIEPCAVHRFTTKNNPFSHTHGGVRVFPGVRVS